MLAVIILAGGESRRMGRPKALLPFPGNFPFAAPLPAEDRPPRRAEKAPAQPKTFLCHLIDVTRHPRAGVLRVVVGAHAKEIAASAKLDPDELVVNTKWGCGQLSSLQAAIHSLHDYATEGILVCLVDHPLISENIAATLIEAFDHAGNQIILPTYQGRRGHPVIFPSRLYSELLAAPVEIGARAVVRAHREEIVEVPVHEEGILLNLNDPETLRRIEHHN